jgi:hypothetical protein
MRKIKSIEFGLATRYLLFTIMLCALCINVKAQKLGFIGGPSMSYGIVSTSDKAASFTMIPGGGMHVGMLFEMDVTNRWGFDAAVMYELRTMRWDISYVNDSTSTNISNRFKRQLGYLNVPFHFYVNFPVQNKYVFSLFGGPVFACGLHGEDWAWQKYTENVPEGVHKPITYEKENMFGDKGRIVRCEIAAELGLAFKWKGVQGRLSYQHGFNNDNFTKDTKKYLFTLPLKNAKPYFTQGTVKLSVAYVFDLRK